MLRAQTMVCALVCVGLLGACSQTGGMPAAHDAFGRPTPTTLTTQPDTVRRPAARVKQPYDSTIRAVVADLQRFWSAQFAKEYGDTYEPMRTFYAYGPSTNMPVCDGQRVPYLLLQGNAFYCGDGGDDFIAWDDVGLFPRLDRIYGRFTIALVLAHEWGHAIQHRAEVDEDTIIMEQQADCFAGAWAKHLPTTPAGSALSADPADLDSAVAGLVGFRDPIGVTQATEGSHGTGFDRVRAFQEGYADGVTRCVEYENDPPTLVGLAFPDLRSRLFGGDRPFRSVVPQVTKSLDVHWGRLFDATKVESVAGPDRASCVGDALGAEGVPTNDLSYCPADRTVRWRVDAMRSIYDEKGDFAVAVAFAKVWARIYAVHDDGPTVSSHRADCRSGAWAREVYDITPKGGEPNLNRYSPVFGGKAFDIGVMTLLPGDLDEAVQALLGSLGSEARGSDKPFARVDAFRRGFFDGAAAC